MRAFFPFAVLVLAAIIPACTCGSREAPPAPEPTTNSVQRANSALVRTNLRIPGRIQLNSSGLRTLRTAPVPTLVPTVPASASAP